MMRRVSPTLRPTLIGHASENAILRSRSIMNVARIATRSFSSKTPYALAILPPSSASSGSSIPPSSRDHRRWLSASSTLAPITVVCSARNKPRSLLKPVTSVGQINEKSRG
jgi:hypothetical protein